MLIKTNFKKAYMCNPHNVQLSLVEPQVAQVAEDLYFIKSDKVGGVAT